MKAFEAPVMEVIRFSAEDIITTSSEEKENETPTIPGL